MRHGPQLCAAGLRACLTALPSSRKVHSPRACATRAALHSCRARSQAPAATQVCSSCASTPASSCTPCTCTRVRTLRWGARQGELRGQRWRRRRGECAAMRRSGGAPQPTAGTGTREASGTAGSRRTCSECARANAFSGRPACSAAASTTAAVGASGVRPQDSIMSCTATACSGGWVGGKRWAAGRARARRRVLQRKAYGRRAQPQRALLPAKPPRAHAVSPRPAPARTPPARAGAWRPGPG